MIRYQIKIILFCLRIMAIKQGLIHEDDDDEVNDMGRNCYRREGTRKFTQMFGPVKQKSSECTVACRPDSRRRLRDGQLHNSRY
jgi:hypothetical protein